MMSVLAHAWHQTVVVLGDYFETSVIRGEQVEGRGWGMGCCVREGVRLLELDRWKGEVSGCGVIEWVREKLMDLEL